MNFSCHPDSDCVLVGQVAQICQFAPIWLTTRWSRLNRDQYLDYQHKLRAEITTRYGADYAPLDWEADVWIERGPEPTP
ncbi:hypothetical protein GCM10009720_28930 [Yaniella flava]|uniref:Uncharacterized protein n=1 Tax=Yaniella flava TaxID=287930 RepID=A0ABP5GGT0_9MICC